jgi:hypothetical protein
VTADSSVQHRASLEIAVQHVAVTAYPALHNATDSAAALLIVALEAEEARAAHDLMEKVSWPTS